MSNSYPWSQMLDEFRQLGGKAENIEQRVGQYGNGIFPIDPDAPIAIEIPESLLVDTDKLLLDGEELVVDRDCGVPGEVQEFVARYQKHFSWGADGRRNVNAFESALKSLPDPLLKRLRELRLLNLEVRHKGDWNEVLRQSFLQSRKIRYHKRKVSMPIIELINHSPRSAGYFINDGIKIRGRFADEVTVNYSPFSDSLVRFLTYGFANQETYAFSLGLNIKTRDGDITIGYDSANLEQIDGLSLPKVEVESDRYRLTHLKLAAEKTPRMPRTVFRKVLRNFPTSTADEFFDRIRNANQIELYNLLELTDGIDTEIGKEFRRAVLFQLRALTHCYGVRSVPA